MAAMLPLPFGRPGLDRLAGPSASAPAGPPPGPAGTDAPAGAAAGPYGWPTRGEPALPGVVEQARAADARGGHHDRLRLIWADAPQGERQVLLLAAAPVRVVAAVVGDGPVRVQDAAPTGPAAPEVHAQVSTSSGEVVVALVAPGLAVTGAHYPCGGWQDVHRSDGAAVLAIGSGLLCPVPETLVRVSTPDGNARTLSLDQQTRPAEPADRVTDVLAWPTRGRPSAALSGGVDQAYAAQRHRPVDGLRGIDFALGSAPDGTRYLLGQRWFPGDARPETVRLVEPPAALLQGTTLTRTPGSADAIGVLALALAPTPAAPVGRLVVAAPAGATVSYGTYDDTQVTDPGPSGLLLIDRHRQAEPEHLLVQTPDGTTDRLVSAVIGRPVAGS